MSIVNFAEVLVAIRKTSSVSDSDLGLANDLHLAAEGAVKDRLGYKVESDTYTYYWPTREVGLWSNGISRGGRILILPHRPVTAISQIDEDADGYFAQASSAFSSSDTLTEGTDYLWQLDCDSDGDGTYDASMSGKVTRLNKGWTTAPGSVKVQYTAGWTNANIPKAIRRAVVITAGNWFTKTSGSGATGRIVTQERLGDYSVQYHVDDDSADLVLPATAEALLREWKRPDIRMSA